MKKVGGVGGGPSGGGMTRVQAMTNLISLKKSILGGLRTQALLRYVTLFEKFGFSDKAMNIIIKVMTPYKVDFKREIVQRGGEILNDTETIIEGFFDIEGGFKVKVTRDFSSLKGSGSSSVPEIFKLVNPKNEEISLHYGFSDDYGLVKAK